MTLFQFHDLDAGGAAALEQARSGHELLAPVWLGGQLASQLWVFRSSAIGYKPTFYDPATQTSVVLIQDREVPASEMGIASATRVHPAGASSASRREAGAGYASSPDLLVIVASAV